MKCPYGKTGKNIMECLTQPCDLECIDWKAIAKEQASWKKLEMMI